MKALLTGILAVAVAVVVSTAEDRALAQGQPSPASAPSGSSGQAAPVPSRIAPGSVIPVLLTKSIDAKKVKIGDEVEAKVTQDLKADGELIIAKDTKVLGHVTQAQARSKEQKESQVGIVFDHTVMKNGENLQLSMSIQAIIAPPSSSPVNDSAGPSPGQGGGGMSQGGGRVSGAVGGAASSPPAPPAGGDGAASASGSNARPAITGDTRGVVGISNLNLVAAPDTNQGSILSSDKNNVKLESGIFMLLRVNQ